VLLACFVFAHVRGWPMMPSSVERLQGSADTSVEASALSARMGGELRIRADSSGSLYTVAPLRGGGDIGIPGSVEHSQGGSVSVELIPNPDPGLYQFSGWNLTLSIKPVWNLSLRGVIDADMTALNITSLQIEGSGSVSVGEPDGISPISVDGEFMIELPAGVPVRVVGPAEVPDGWLAFEGDIVSPSEGQGWIIAISEGSVVRIKEG
jgi:hypothetical protein